jgi:hypothetical protein
MALTYFCEASSPVAMVITTTEHELNLAEVFIFNTETATKDCKQGIQERS